jgi:hypothetical protein
MPHARPAFHAIQALPTGHSASNVAPRPDPLGAHAQSNGDFDSACRLHDAAREEGTRVADNLFTALWKRHAQHAATWRALCLGQAVITVLALVLAFTLLHRPREVVRIGCDGIPQLVRLDVQQYAEPNEREIQAFVRTWAVAYARAARAGARGDAGPERARSRARPARGGDGSAAMSESDPRTTF